MAHAGPVLRQVDVRQIAQHARRVVPRVGRRVFLAHVQLKPAVGEERVGGRRGRTRLPIIVIRTQEEWGNLHGEVFMLSLLFMH